MTISFLLITSMCDSGVNCREKLDAGHSQGLKGYTTGQKVQPSKNYKQTTQPISKNLRPTFPESVKPVNTKFMSSPLLHLSVVPSMFNSTLFGSAGGREERKYYFHYPFKHLFKLSNCEQNTQYIILTFLPKLQPTGGSIFNINTP